MTFDSTPTWHTFPSADLFECMATINSRVSQGTSTDFQAAMDLVLKDRFGAEIVPREWFVVPLPVIEEALEKLIDGSIAKCRYDAKTASIVDEAK